MGLRGPKPGFKQARAAAAKKGAATPLSSMSAADRENPEKLTGELLRAHAHRRGLAKSALEGMTDERIRTELRYITHRQYDEAA